MPVIDAKALTDFTAAIFERSKVPPAVARQVADSLVQSNLKGHDSHGVLRIIEYVDWVADGRVNSQGRLTVLREEPCILILDGDFGFGQVIGREAMILGIEKAKKEGVCILSLKRSGHLGRVGEFMEMAAEAGLVCFSFTNTHGGGVLVAPHGGCERRLSANPIGGGAPMPDSPAMVMDISTSTIAEGKIKVALSKGESLSPGLVVNASGEPSTSPKEYYGKPPGALLPMSGHKGFALSMFCEVMAGALTGAGCSRPGVERVANGFMAFLLDPAAFSGKEFFEEELGRLAEWVKSSHLTQGFQEILLPGEPEAKAQAAHEHRGVMIDETTWNAIQKIAAARHVPIPEVTASKSENVARRAKLDVSLYQKRGYLAPVQIFPPEDVPHLLGVYHRLRKLLPPGTSTQKMDWWHGYDRELMAICAHPKILDNVEDLLGPDFYLWGTQFFSKDPGDGKTTPWHQDAFYWPLSPHKSVTLWLAFTDTDELNGAMQVVPGTHRSGRLKHQPVNGTDAVLDMVLEEGSFRLSDAVHLKLKAGQSSLHDDNIVHGSGPNQSNRLRCGLTMRFSAGEVKCDTSVWPFFKAYWVRGKDRWHHNPIGAPPKGFLEKYVHVTA